jgi:hypothetical protein
MPGQDLTERGFQSKLLLTPDQRIVQGRPLWGCDGHCAEPGAGVLSEIGFCGPGVGPEIGAAVPFEWTVCWVCGAEFEVV